MSYRRKKTAGVVFAMALSMTAVAGCTGTKEQYWQCCFLGNRNKCRRNISTE